MSKIKYKEELLIRSGDLLNSLGILRSAKIHNYSLTKEKFIELVKRNYNIIDTLPLRILEKLELIWKDSINFFEEMGINNNSTSTVIRIKEIHLDYNF